MLITFVPGHCLFLFYFFLVQRFLRIKRLFYATCKAASSDFFKRSYLVLQISRSILCRYKMSYGICFQSFVWSFTSGIFLILLHELLNGKKCIMTSIQVPSAIVLYLNLKYEVEDGQTKKQIMRKQSRRSASR